jgi:hypothetical protein
LLFIWFLRTMEVIDSSTSSSIMTSGGYVAHTIAGVAARVLYTWIPSLVGELSCSN